ncbi:MAG: hypothetical protein V4757_07245 [Pseudomonadota bacterium]
MLAVVRGRQEMVDRFYAAHGPCCAGCDWWRHFNSMVGECIRTVPVGGVQRIAMLGITGSSLQPGAGHIMTPRDHVCGEFKDDPA